MGFLAILNAYTMRICLSITITEMTIPIHHNYSNDTERCPKIDVDEKQEIDITNRYDWDEHTQVRDTSYEIKRETKIQ